VFDIKRAIWFRDQSAHYRIHDLVRVRLTSFGPGLIRGGDGFLERSALIGGPYRRSTMSGRAWF
jgi:hypothetical protein